MISVLSPFLSKMSPKLFLSVFLPRAPMAMIFRTYGAFHLLIIGSHRIQTVPIHSFTPSSSGISLRLTFIHSINWLLPQRTTPKVWTWTVGHPRVCSPIFYLVCCSFLKPVCRLSPDPYAGTMVSSVSHRSVLPF